jgi:hypothetical protein
MTHTIRRSSLLKTGRSLAALSLVVTLCQACGRPTSAQAVTALDFSRQIIGVEQKAAKVDQGVPVIPDMTFGVPAPVIVERMKAMGVNLMTIPISRDDSRPTAEYVKRLKSNGGASLAIVISDRKWGLDREKNRREWAEGIATCFHALEAAGCADMVKACRFDENDPLKGEPSTAPQWTERFNNIVQSMDLLNELTDGAFKRRTVLMHGEGYGSNFKGIREAHVDSDFEARMATRCSNYAFTFKHFDTGEPADGKYASTEEWEAHFRNHSGLDEFAELGKPLMFVGNAGDGLFPNSLVQVPSPPRPWCNQIAALQRIFQQHGWHHFAFGPMIQPSDDKGRTVLHHAHGTRLANRGTQLSDWLAWREGVTP